MSATYLGRLIQDLRSKVAKSQSTLADECGIAKQTLIDIELGRRTPTFVTLRKLARGLGVPVELLSSALAGC